MTINVKSLLTFATLATLILAAALHAAEPAMTTINVEKMHCAGCAKKLCAKVQELAGVAKVEADVKSKLLTVKPKAGVVLSPRALWEAIEASDDMPTKLTGPSGTFTSNGTSW